MQTAYLLITGTCFTQNYMGHTMYSIIDVAVTSRDDLPERVKEVNSLTIHGITFAHTVTITTNLVVVVAGCCLV